MSLKIADNLSLPTEAVTQTFAILAKRGVGKTYTASVMVEEMLKANLHVVVVDPIGVWFGLRSSADGKSAGFPIIIAGGEHADVPIEPSSGEVLAEMIVDQHLSMVIDISLFRKGEQHKFMTAFAETLYRRNRQAVHLVLDEADEFAPQRTMGDEARMLGAIEDLVRRGRARGIGVTMITQRPAVLNKNVLTQIEVLVALRLTSPQDRAAIAEWVKYHADGGQAQEMLESLGALPVGTAWFWSPGWLDIFKKVQVRKRETLDSSSTPKVGQRVIAAQKMADVDLEKIRQQLSLTIEKVESDDPKVLRQRIVKLKKELSDKKPQITIAEVPVIPDEQLGHLLQMGENLVQFGNNLIETVKAHKPVHHYQPMRREDSTLSQPFASPSTVMNTQADKKPIVGGALRMLQVLASRYPMTFTKSQLALLSSMSPKSGTYGTYLSLLRSQGLIEVGAEVSITEEGMNYIGADKPKPQSQEEVLDMWRSNLTGGARRMFDVLVDEYPQQVSKVELGERTDMSYNSGTFGTYLSLLRRNGLVEVAGSYVKASSNLFVASELKQAKENHVAR